MARRKQTPGPMAETLALLNAGLAEQAPGEKEPVKTPDATATTLAAVQKQLEELQKNYSNLEASHTALLSTPAQYTKPTPRPVDIDLSNLPDPTEDKDGFARELVTRQRKALENLRYNDQLAASEAQDSANQMNQLWADFQEKHKDYAGDPTRVRIAVGEVMAVAQRKKLDMNRYMYVNSDRFMKDVTKVYDGLFGAPKALEADDEGDDGMDDDDLRTIGIMGGQESNGKPAASAKAPEKPKGFTEAIREFQLKHGYYR